MNNFKKYLPLIVLGAAVLIVMLVVFWPSSGPKDDPLSDRDSDGVIDVSDLCPDVKGDKGNQGCPEKTKNERDLDKDGIGNKSDSDDLNPCVPNENCASCDLDGDGWSYAMEISKHTSPKLKDTDGDGIKDPNDKCPLKKGSAENDGCPSDSDGDGVMDNVDACPNIGKLTASYLNYDKSGCPLVDTKLNKVEGKNELSWKLDGYKGDLELTLTYVDNEGRVKELSKIPLPPNTTSKNLGSLPGKVNGRTITVTLNALGSPDVKFKNASLSTDQFKCSVSKNR